MLLDQETYLSEAQVITSSKPSTNVFDGKTQGTAYLSPLYFVSRVAVPFSGTGTVSIQLQTASDEAFTSPKTFDLGTFTVAQLTSGFPVKGVLIPLGTLRYLRANYVVAGGTITGGALDTFLVDNVTFQEIYGKNYWNN